MKVFMTDNSYNEDGLLLDEEDQTFLVQDIGAGISTVEIEPNSAPIEEYLIENKQHSITLSFFQMEKISYTPYKFRDMLYYKFGELRLFRLFH